MNWEPCPRCGSVRVKKESNWLIVYVGLLIGAIGGIISPGLLTIGIIFMVVGIPIGILVWALNKDKIIMQCKDCGFRYEIIKSNSAEKANDPAEEYRRVAQDTKFSGQTNEPKTKMSQEVLNKYHIYYLCEGKQMGPIKFDQLLEFIECQEVKEDTLIWVKGFKNWEELSNTFFCDYISDETFLGKPIKWSGGLYAGEMKDGRPHGRGKFTYPDGHSYKGDWVDGKKHGSGIFTYPSGAYCVNQWEDDQPLEGGKMIYPDKK